MTLSDAIHQDLEELEPFARKVARRYRLSCADGDDIRAIVERNVTRAITKGDTLRDTLLQSQERRKYLVQCILNAARSLWRRPDESFRREAVHRCGDLPIEELAVSADETSLPPSAVEDARVILGKVAQGLGSQGELALTLLSTHTTDRQYAIAHGMSVRTVRRRFVRGVAFLRHAIDRELRNEFGDECFLKFREACIVAMETALS